MLEVPRDHRKQFGLAKGEADHRLTLAKLVRREHFSDSANKGRLLGELAWRTISKKLPAAVRRAIERMSEASFAVSMPRPRCNLRGGKDSALRTLSSLAEEQPNDPGAIRELAFSAMDRRLYAQAYGLLRRTTDLAPGDARTYHWLARCLEAMARCELAMVYYELAYDAGFDASNSDAAPVDVAVDYLRFLRREIGGRLTGDVAKLAGLRLAAITAECDLAQADLVVSIHWNTDETDIDLRVAEPDGEQCCYYHQRTTIGGRLGGDVRDGLGGETYVLRNGAKGKYVLSACYQGYGGGRPTTVYATIYEHWGTRQERVTRRTVTLARSGVICDLGVVVIDHYSASGFSTINSPAAGSK